MRAAMDDLDKINAGKTIVAEPVLRHGPFAGRIEPDRVAAYAAATGDQTAAVLAGDAVPAVYPVILAFGAQQAANSDLPPAAWQQAYGGVHGAHDIVLHRPLVLGEYLQTWSQISAIRTVRPGTQVVLHIEQRDNDGTIVVEQWWTTVLLGLHEMADRGVPPDDHRVPDAARLNPIGKATHQVDEQVAHRYAEVSGDWSAHHFDIAAARASGFDFLFTHGLCTMAICAHRVLGIVGVDDPGRVSRVAVRFASPTPLGSDLAIDVFRIDEWAWAFEATCKGVKTVSHGRLELRS
jgi:acyl dehydratase